MTAVNVISTKDGIHLFADTASYDVDGKVLGFRSKLRAIGTAGAALAGSGIGPLIDAVFGALSGARSFAELVERLPACFIEAAGRFAGALEGLPTEVEIYAAGYAGGKASVVSLKGDARSPSDAQVIAMPAGTWAFQPSPQHDGFNAVGKLTVAGLEAMNKHGENMPLDLVPAYASTILQIQRHSKTGYGQLAGGMGAYVVGGSGELMTCWPDGQVSSRLLVHWDDVIGERIMPECYRKESAT